MKGVRCEPIPLKYGLAKVYSGGTPDTTNTDFWADDQNGIPWVSIADITASGGQLSNTARHITAKGLESKGLEIVPKGTLLLSIFASLGKTTTLAIDSTINQAILGLATNDKLFAPYLKYYLQHLERRIDEYSSSNTQANLNLEKVKNLPILPLPYEQQLRIVTFLDEKTAKIDTLIEKKRKLIELLKEERQAVINHAVTKGLNPNAKMKPSGIEWLGDVPEHWEVKKLKHLLKPLKGALKTGPFGSDLKTSDLTDSGIRVYNQRSVLDNDFQAGEYISEAKFESLREFEVHEGDILITSRGTIGACAIFPEGQEKGILHPCLIRIQIKRDLVLPNYLMLFLRDSSLFKENVLYNSNATTIAVIYGDTLKHVFIPIPPINEQMHLVSVLDSTRNELEVLIQKAERSIELLTEYRTALITEAVTGKVEIPER